MRRPIAPMLSPTTSADSSSAEPARIAGCGGRLRLVALIERASVVQGILRHLGLPTELPEPRPARAPPRQPETFEDQSRTLPSSTRRGEGVASGEEERRRVVLPDGSFPLALSPAWLIIGRRQRPDPRCVRGDGLRTSVMRTPRRP